MTPSWHPTEDAILQLRCDADASDEPNWKETANYLGRRKCRHQARTGHIQLTERKYIGEIGHRQTNAGPLFVSTLVLRCTIIFSRVISHSLRNWWWDQSLYTSLHYFLEMSAVILMNVQPFYFCLLCLGPSAMADTSQPLQAFKCIPDNIWKLSPS